MSEFVFKVARFDGILKIDSIWDKPEWQPIDSLLLTNWMGEKPAFWPVVQVKMMYNPENLFLIYRVEDKYVKCLTTEVNGPVYSDSCVEFFFSPDPEFPSRYFNLEINCGGTALFHYNLISRKEKRLLTHEDINQVEIATSLPEIVNPEITDKVIWTVECRIPMAVLQKYSNLAKPAKGTLWPANFYKIADSGSNIHFITWTFIDLPKPDFHRPDFFGYLLFDS